MDGRGKARINHDLTNKFVLPKAGHDSQTLSVWQHLDSQRLNATKRHVGYIPVTLVANDNDIT